MKGLSLIICTLLITNVYASACPDLTGNYICQNGPQSWNLDVNQSSSGNKVEYTFIEDGVEDIITPDGIIHQLDDTPEMVDISYSAFCQNNLLLLRIAGSETGTNQRILANSTFSKSENVLTMEVSGTFGDHQIPIQTTTCTGY